MKKVIIASLVMFIGCSTTIEPKNSSYKHILNPKMCEKQCFDFETIYDDANTAMAGVVTILALGVPIIPPKMEQVCDITIDEAIDIVAAKSVQANYKQETLIGESRASETQKGRPSDIHLTARPVAKTEDIFLVKVDIRYFPIATMNEETWMCYREYKYDRVKQGVVLLRENVPEDEANKRIFQQTHGKK